MHSHAEAWLCSMFHIWRLEKVMTLSQRKSTSSCVDVQKRGRDSCRADTAFEDPILLLAAADGFNFHAVVHGGVGYGNDQIRFREPVEHFHLEIAT